MTTVRLFAAAADVAGTTSEEVEATDLGALLAELGERHGDHFTQVLGRCSLLLDGVKVTDPATPLQAGARLDVLPPFAGG